MKNIEEKINKLVEQMCGNNAKYLKEWNGYSVYDIEYQGNTKGGYPLVILVSNSEIRLSTLDECIAFWGLHCKFKKTN